jgi:hypothetical protein
MCLRPSEPIGKKIVTRHASGRIIDRDYDRIITQAVLQRRPIFERPYVAGDFTSANQHDTAADYEPGDTYA